MPTRKLPPDQEIIDMYQSGMSSGEIAEACGNGIKPGSVISLLRRRSVPRRSAKEAAETRDERGRANPARYWLGKKQPQEMIDKRTAKYRGENHYLWKGGHSLRKYRGIIEKVKCAICGSKLNLSIHHIDFDHYNDDPENLQALCVSCHMSLHKQAYWDAIHAGKEPPLSNGPVGWTRSKKE